MAPRGRPTRTTRSRPVTAIPPPVTTTPPPVTDPTTTTSVTSAQLQAMIDEGVTAVLAARATTQNGDDSHTSGTGARRNERTVRECTYQDFMKCQPLFFRGTEGAVDLTQWFERMETVFRISNCIVENQVKFATCTLMGTALTWWNLHARTVTNEVAYAMTWSDLKKKMTTKYCPRNEIKKIEVELWNLKVKGTDVPKTMQEAIEMATELMDRRNNTFAERQAENKRKFEDTPRNNQTQQPNKRQNTGRAYAAGNGDRKPYEGAKPRCPKTVGADLQLQITTTTTAITITTTTATTITTTTVTTTTQEPKGQISMPSFALSAGLQATSGRTAPSGRTRIREMWNEKPSIQTYKEQTNFQGSTAQIPPPVNLISIPKLDVPKTLPKTTPIPESDIPKSLPKPNIPYPSRRDDQKSRDKASNQMEKIFQIFQDLRFDISFADAFT
ncbi:reverse transcriptase domain-containing protein [Tanacetum coccineum]